jgi:hypothetical protein
VSARRGTGRHATDTPVIVLAGEDRNDRQCLKIAITALRPDIGKRIVEINDTVRLRDSRDTVTGRVDRLINQAKARADREDSPLAALFLHEDYDGVDCDVRDNTRARVQEALSKRFEKAFYVLATWEIEAWLLLFPDALAATHPSWQVPPKYLGRDTARIADPKRVLKEEVSRSGPRYRESDAADVLAKAAELDLLARPRGSNGSWREFTAAIASWDG